MTRTTYWCFMAAAALMAGSLMTLPLWDYFHYRQATTGGLPASSTTLAVMTGAPATTSAPPSTERPARSWPAGENVPTLSPISKPAPTTGQPDGRPPVPARAPITARPIDASPVAMARTPPATAPVQRTTGATRSRIEAVPARQGAGTGTREPADPTSGERPIPAVNQVTPVGWIAGGVVAGSPAMPEHGAQSPPASQDRAGQNEQSQPSGTAETAPDPQDAPSLRLSLAPDRHAVSRGETLSVGVVLTGARDITSVPFHLQFDPGVLEFVGARAGPALNGRSLQPIFLAAVNPNRPGDLAVGLSLVRSSGTFNGSGAILLLDFRALATGRSDLLFDRASVRGPTSELLPAEILGSAAEVR